MQRLGRLDAYLYYSGAIFLVMVAVFPIYWTLISSLKSPAELISATPTFFPQSLTLEYYIDVWNLKNISDNITLAGAFWNSAVVSLGTIVLTVVLSTMAGYALAIFDLPFKEVIFVLLILPILVPILSLVVPLYILLKQLGMIDTYMGLICIHTVGLLPIGTFVMRNAFQSIPGSLRELAILEGSAERRILVQVLLPLALPGLLTVMVFAMYISWNDYLMAFIFTNQPEMTMLNVALAKIARGAAQFEMKWGHLTAGSMISFIPIIVFYAFLQKYFVRGVTGGSVKE
ncbi:MAG: carbohydrate ABC transporter permease [Hyphomicrobiales bacterium]|nr:carbohydrate ABC transporter permease [Hyphomicrobiales bacterium]